MSSGEYAFTELLLHHLVERDHLLFFRVEATSCTCGGGGGPAESSLKSLSIRPFLSQKPSLRRHVAFHT